MLRSEIVDFICNENDNENIENRIRNFGGNGLDVVIETAMKHDKHFPINYILDHHNNFYLIENIKNKIFVFGNIHFFTVMNEQNQLKKFKSKRLGLAIKYKQNELIFNHLLGWICTKQIFRTALHASIKYKNMDLFNYLIGNEELSRFIVKESLCACFSSTTQMSKQVFEIMSQKYLELL
jgi:hypothetical protein